MYNNIYRHYMKRYIIETNILLYMKVYSCYMRQCIMTPNILLT